MSASIQVQVVYALPARQDIVTIELPEGATAVQAVEASGLMQKYPDIDLARNKLGVFAKLVKADAQAVLIIASGSAVVDANNAIRTAGSAAQIVTLSNNASTGFIKSLGANARGVIVTQVYPNERAVTYPMVKEAQELAKTKGLTEISPAMLEGFAAAKVLVEGLKRAGPKPTREKIQTALESIKKLDLGGLEVNFSPEDHTGLDFADLAIIGTDGRFRR